MQILSIVKQHKTLYRTHLSTEKIVYTIRISPERKMNEVGLYRRPYNSYIFIIHIVTQKFLEWFHSLGCVRIIEENLYLKKNILNINGNTTPNGMPMAGRYNTMDIYEKRTYWRCIFVFCENWPHLLYISNGFSHTFLRVSGLLCIAFFFEHNLLLLWIV